jgi:hypothetical protein
MHDWMFEAGGEPLSLTLAEQPGSPAPVAADWFSHEPADDFETWLFETPAKGDLGPMFIEGEGEGEDEGDDDGAHELDEVVVTGRRVEGFPTAVQVTIGDFFELPPIEVGGGGTSGTQTLGPDLSIYNCAMLADLEQRITDSFEFFRASAASILGATTLSDGLTVFNEIYQAFEDLEARGLYDPDNPFGNIARVYAETGNATNALSTSLRTMGITLALDSVAMSFVESAFRAQQNLERINAEQARRSGCG